MGANNIKKPMKFYLKLYQMGIDIDIGTDISKYMGNEDEDGMRMTWGERGKEGPGRARLRNQSNSQEVCRPMRVGQSKGGQELPSPRGF